MRVLYVVPLLALFFLACNTSVSQDLEAIDEEQIETLISHLSDTTSIRSSQFPAQLQQALRPFDPSKAQQYSEVTDFYTSVLKVFAGQYPDGLFDIDPKRALQPYRGRKIIEVPEVHAFPFIPITPLSYVKPSLQFQKLTISFDGRIIHGLEVTTLINQSWRQLPVGNKIDELYVPDVNARVLGFTHAQLIPALSNNVEAASVFNYNGIQQWSTHQHYKQNDQVNRPIRLTNYAHATGDRFAISAHPDFALTLPDALSEGAVLTFFLWNANQSANTRKKNTLPDFVYRFRYRDK